MIACVACARALSVCRKRRGKKKNYRKRRARDQKNEGASYRSASLSLSFKTGGHGGHGGEFFFNLGPEKQKLGVVRYIYVYVRM